MIRAAAPQPVLAVDNIVKSYGGPIVLDGVSLSVAAGEVLGIIGPNGSGKTTLFGVISGVHPPSKGTVWMDGVDITTMSAPARSIAGIGRTFQVPQSFGDMSIYENLLVAARFGGGLGAQEADILVLDLIDRCGFAGRSDTLAGALPLLDRKRLELARALATRPSVVLLDEIAGGLTDDEASSVAELVKELARRGLAVIWIEHLVHILTHAADRIAVLGDGRIVASGEPHATMALPAVRKIYLGMEPDAHDLDS
ncbi:ABC transporter ATP-binding protein [Rhizobium leguminosarum]|uniref:ABC transporter ATP-binding protein n=1 Tax=Rhizobium leguminosarum TaxID=384 RepID=UPI003ECE6DE8